MAVLAIRLADSINGVSQLHGDVVAHMWHNLWPGVPADEVPISTSPTAFTSAPGSRRTSPSRSTAISSRQMDERSRPTRRVWEGVIADSRRRTLARPRALPRAPGRLGAADAARAASSAAAAATTTWPWPTRCSIPRR